MASSAGPLNSLGKGCWMLHSRFSMYGIFPICNNGLLVKLANGLAVVNPVELDEAGFASVERLCAEHGPLRVIFSPGDWHHIYVSRWQDRFPDAATYVVSERVFRKNAELAERRQSHHITVLDRLKPTLPEFGSEVQLVPFLGAKIKESLCGAFADRTEVVVLHKASGTLFVTDHCFPKSVLASWGVARDSGFKANTMGFQIKDREETRRTALGLLSLDFSQAVFSHLKPEEGALYRAADLKDKLRAAYVHYL